MAENTQHTPLYSCHKSQGAKFTEFCGWDMPVQYVGISKEHCAVRKQVGLFDVSHMGEFLISGSRAYKFLQFITSNDVSKISPGRAQYSLLLNKMGGILDDIIVYCIEDGEYLLCTNACNTQKDYKWLNEHNSFGATIENVSADFAQLALQGPYARTVLARVLGIAESEVSNSAFPPFSHKVWIWRGPVGMVSLRVATTGYTGEDGCEIFFDPSIAWALWDAIVEAGHDLSIQPCGLGARDTLRLEAGLPLWGHELTEDIPALCAGLGWAIKRNTIEFMGGAAIDALRGQKEFSPKLVGCEVIETKVDGQNDNSGCEAARVGVVRAGAEIFCDGNRVGWVTSGTITPTLNKAIAFAYVQAPYARLGQELVAVVRNKTIGIRVIPTPFYKRNIDRRS